MSFTHIKTVSEKDLLLVMFRNNVGKSMQETEDVRVSLSAEKIDSEKVSKSQLTGIQL